MKKSSIDFQRTFHAFFIFAFFTVFVTISTGMKMSFQEDETFFLIQFKIKMRHVSSQ